MGAAVLAACARPARTGGSGCVTEQAPSAVVKATARAARVATGLQGKPTGCELMQFSQAKAGFRTKFEVNGVNIYSEALRSKCKHR